MGARVFESLLPREEHTAIELALHGGEDLQLLFAVSPARARLLPMTFRGTRLTRIGEIVPARKSARNLTLMRGSKEHPLPALGFQHF